MQDRPYQTQAEDATVSEYDKGVRRMMHVMATGTGKTIVFSNLYSRLKSRLPGQMLVIAHTEELVKQNADKMKTVNPSAAIGIEMAGSYADEWDDIICGSVQTLGRKDSTRLAKFNNIDKVVIDEAHHSVTDGYRRILDATGVLQLDTNKLLLGVTATPQRPDGEPLSDLFEKVTFVYGIRAAIRDGWLCDIRGFRIATDTDLSAVEKSGSDFINSQLVIAVNTEDRNRRIVEAWLKFGEDRQTLVFAVDIQHAQDLAQAFRDRDIFAVAVWGDDPLRKDKLDTFRAGQTKVLCNCQVLTEGYDDPSIACVVLARPTASDILFTQMVGRGTRLHPGKKDLLVLDVVDDTTRHTLLTLPTLMGLHAGLDLEGRSVTEAVEELEALKEKHPSVDFTKLDLLSRAKWVIEQVDLFQVRFPAEVETNSELTWFRAVDGGYKMLIPKEGAQRAGFLRMYENAIGKWELTGRINDEEFHGIRPTMEELFKVADEQVRKRVNPITLQCILRSATWHNKPVTPGQKQMLERLFPHKQFLYEQMNAGQASKLISEKLTRKI